MLAGRKLSPNYRGRLAARSCWERCTASKHAAAGGASGGVSVGPTPPVAGPLHVDDRHRLSSTAGIRQSTPLPREHLKHVTAPFGALWDVGGVRHVSSTGRAAAKVKLAHGAKMETPAIPAFIEIRCACGRNDWHILCISLMFVATRKSLLVLVSLDGAAGAAATDVCLKRRSPIESRFANRCSPALEGVCK